MATSTATGRPVKGTESRDRSTPPVLDRPDRACRDVDPDVFFPERGESPDAALELCERCPCRWPCRDWAIQTRQEFGIYGATTPGERRKILRRRSA